MARVRANLAALRTLREIQHEQRPATSDEQQVLARWSGWGAVPQVFDDRRGEFAAAREELGELLSVEEYRAAERNTLNAHYTDPALVTAIWGGLGELGLDSGRILEPGCGTGNFLGLAPTAAELVGVEVDPTSAGIAAALYPEAQILAESFADTRAADAAFDAAVGNVPFGNITLTDARHNPSGQSMHNHFITKSLHLTKPGGMVAVLTSRYTLDARNPAARREMAALADVVGAVRLPAGAHQRTAGTEAVTDLLILRRREPDRSASGPEWEQTRTVTLGGHDVALNQYFLDHPEHVLGTLDTVDGLYREGELHVTANAEPTAPALATALSGIATTARQNGLTAAPVASPHETEPVVLVAAADHRTEGHLTAHADGSVTQLVGGVDQPHTVPNTQADELRALLGLRDTTLALLDVEAAQAGESDRIDELRAELGQRYDTYVAAYGPINRFTWRATGRTDPETGQPTYAQQRPGQGRFRDDPHAPTVAALESYDPETGQTRKEDIFSRRVIAPRSPRLGADSPADALAISLDASATVDLDHIARLLGTEPDDARAQLGTLVFDDPETRALVPAADYLSGNVRAKYEAAQAAHEEATDNRYRANLDALAEAVPPDLSPDQIRAQLGAAWIGEADVAAFLRETLGDESVRVQHAGGANWLVDGAEHTVDACETWGTERISAPRIAQALLQQRPVTVYDTIHYVDGSDRRVLNAEATAQAQEKATALNNEFAQWVFDDPRRAKRLAAVYNRQFNSVVARNYDDVELSLPGLALTFQPRSHQVAAVARMIHEPAVGLYHEVGAGKTASMAMGCMELRRLGLVRKPAVVIPNHMLEQFSREWAQLYPQARLLVAGSKHLDNNHRREFVARCATGDWDAVIMTQSAFERIPMSGQAQQEYLQRESDTMRAQLERVNSRNSPMGVKRMQAALERAEEKAKAKLESNKTDPGLAFEATGLDYLVVDEAHTYKNLRTPSNIPEAAIDGSQRASDLDMKLHHLRSKHGNRVGTFATATPIANTITEAYVMQRYLRPDLLAEAGLDDFDTWASTFGQVTTSVELSPDASSFRTKSRFAKFQNVPELLRMWHVSADIKTADDLQLDTPELTPRPEDGERQPRTITVPASAEMQQYLAEIAERAERVAQGGIDREIDNMLKVTGDGRKAALDLRLVGQDTDETTKLDVAAEHIAALHAAHADDVYHDPDGTPQQRTGSLQLVFADLGTPNTDGSFSAYDELRAQLTARGVPRGQVRFIHEAKNDKEKGELFAAARDGRIAVLVGSTQKMGVGANVQTRAIALHHLDCPWRPADVEQREGRIIRQGNRNPEVGVYRYVTEGSFDAYTWQTVARKAQFIAQVKRGTLDAREIEDIGDSTLSYTEVKALATGNPLLLDHANAQTELTRLERLERGHDRTQQRLPSLIAAAQDQLAAQQSQQQHVAQALSTRQSTKADAFAMTISTTRHTDRGEAKQHLMNQLVDFGRQPTKSTSWDRFARLGGVELTATATKFLSKPEAAITVQVHGVPDTAVYLKDTDRDPANAGLITRLENQIGKLDTVAEDTARAITGARTEIERSHAQLGQPFPHAETLADARHTLAQIEEQMRTEASSGSSEEEATPNDSGSADVGDLPSDDRLADWQAEFATDQEFLNSIAAGQQGDRARDMLHELISEPQMDERGDAEKAAELHKRVHEAHNPGMLAMLRGVVELGPDELSQSRTAIGDDHEFVRVAFAGAYGERAQTLAHGLTLDASQHSNTELADALMNAVADEATTDADPTSADTRNQDHDHAVPASRGSNTSPSPHPARLAAMASPVGQQQRPQQSRPPAPGRRPQPPQRGRDNDGHGR